MKADKVTRHVTKMYDKFGEWYHQYRKSPDNFFNSMVDMPAILRLLGNVRGKSILDAGCGSGIYSRILVRKGAKVSGIDISKTLIKFAQKEVPKAEFKVANVMDIPFKKNSFDIVISALVLDYVKDWDKAFKEIRRVLRPKGTFIFSAGNPVLESRKDVKLGGKNYRIIGYSKDSKQTIGDYFKERWVDYSWKKGQMKLKFHHKTYETIIKTILRNGFEIIDYVDEKPIPKGKRIDEKLYAGLSKLPVFYAFKVRNLR